MEKAKKRNQIFQYLEAIGILMVIDDHTGTTVGFLSGVFPYNSFYMPMFVFISGYFYREQAVWQNVRHKARHLLLPYLIWGGDRGAYSMDSYERGDCKLVCACQCKKHRFFINACFNISAY